jgi:hypothetical protein
MMDQQDAVHDKLELSFSLSFVQLLFNPPLTLIIRIGLSFCVVMLFIIMAKSIYYYGQFGPGDWYVLPILSGGWLIVLYGWWLSIKRVFFRDMPNCIAIIPGVFGFGQGEVQWILNKPLTVQRGLFGVSIVSNPLYGVGLLVPTIAIPYSDLKKHVESANGPRRKKTDLTKEIKGSLLFDEKKPVLQNVNWRKEKNVLILETGQRINFDFNIKGINGNSSSTSFDIKLDIPSEQSGAENQYYVSKKDGTINGKNFVKYPTLSVCPKDFKQAIPEKCTLDWAKEGDVLVLNNEKRVSFDYPIGSIFETCGLLIVVLDVPPDYLMTENVFGVSKQGEIVWQIEPTSKTSYPHPTNFYVGSQDSNIAGLAMIWNFNGTAVFIDVRTGKVVIAEYRG